MVIVWYDLVIIRGKLLESVKENPMEIAKNKNMTRVAMVTALLLSIPLIAMQFSDEVVWTVGDFLVGGALIFGAGFVFVQLSTKMPNTALKYLLGIALAASLLLIWVSLAL